ncbi:MAG: aldo/keto reductase [Streptosporangiales bacterium]|nr:aldo/keto reductase [Streptosporangiales bacterium]
MTAHDSTETIRIADGADIPLVGFGTWQLAGDDAYNGVRTALDLGCRHIDTATAYGNEDRVGAAIRDSGVAREDVFITTKLPPGNAGQERETIEESLKSLGVDYVDLWLVHWPPNGEARPDTWKSFISAQQQGKATSIGVSNYSLDQIDELIQATGQAPALNQIPWNPFAYDKTIADGLKERGVALEGYSPLKKSDLANPVLGEIAAAHARTPAQVILRWHVEHGFVVIPRSSRTERIKENFDLFDFELSGEEISRVDALGA